MSTIINALKQLESQGVAFAPQPSLDRMDDGLESTQAETLHDPDETPADRVDAESPPADPSPCVVTVEPTDEVQATETSDTIVQTVGESASNDSPRLVSPADDSQDGDRPLTDGGQLVVESRDSECECQCEPAPAAEPEPESEREPASAFESETKLESNPGPDPELNLELHSDLDAELPEVKEPSGEPENGDSLTVMLQDAVRELPPLPTVRIADLIDIDPPVEDLSADDLPPDDMGATKPLTADACPESPACAAAEDHDDDPSRELQPHGGLYDIDGTTGLDLTSDVSSVSNSQADVIERSELPASLLSSESNSPEPDGPEPSEGPACVEVDDSFTAQLVDLPALTEQIQPGEKLEPVAQTEPFEQIHPTEPYEPIESVNQGVSIEPLEPLVQIKEAEDVEPVDTVDTVEHLEPGDTVEPIQPSMPRNLADTTHEPDQPPGSPSADSDLDPSLTTETVHVGDGRRASEVQLAPELAAEPAPELAAESAPAEDSSESAPTRQDALSDEGRVYEQSLQEKLADEALAQQYSRALHRMIAASPDGLPTVVMMLSSRHQPHVSETLAHMAMLLIQRDAGRVLLVDAGLPHKTLSRQFGVADRPGLADVCRGDKDGHDLLISGTDPRLCILPAGTGPIPPIIGAGTVRDMVKQWKEEAQIVLVDVGYVDAPLTEALTQAGDSVFLLVRLGQTQGKEAEATVAKLRGLDCSLHGCIVTNAGALSTV